MRILITGGGRAVYFLCRALLSKGHRVTVVHTDRSACTELARRLRVTVLCGDGTDPDVLESAEAGRAQVFLAARETDPDNLVACQIASHRFSVPRVLALVNDPDNEAAFAALGVPTLCLTPIVSSLIEQRMAVEDVTQLMPAAGGKVTVIEVRLGADAPGKGRALREITLPAGALVACVTRGDHVLVPRGNDVLEEGDRLLLVSVPAVQGEALGALVGAE